MKLTWMPITAALAVLAFSTASFAAPSVWIDPGELQKDGDVYNIPLELSTQGRAELPFAANTTDDPRPGHECEIKKEYKWDLSPSKKGESEINPDNTQTTRLTLNGPGAWQKYYDLKVKVTWREFATGPEGKPRGPVTAEAQIRLAAGCKYIRILSEPGKTNYTVTTPDVPNPVNVNCAPNPAKRTRYKDLIEEVRNAFLGWFGTHEGPYSIPGMAVKLQKMETHLVCVACKKEKAMSRLTYVINFDPLVLNSTISTPNWLQRNAAGPKTAIKWDALLVNINTHENGHRTIYNEFRTQAKSKIEAIAALLFIGEAHISAIRSLKDLQTKTEDPISDSYTKMTLELEAIAKINKDKDNTYETTTDHGTTQGNLPPYTAKDNITTKPGEADELLDW